MITLEQIKSIIAKTLDVSPELITDNLSAGEIEQWDSMGNMAIISALEEQLAVEFPMEVLFDLNNVETIYNEVKKLL